MGNRDDALWYWRDVFGHDVKAAAVVAMAEEAGQSLEEFLAAQYDALSANREGLSIIDKPLEGNSRRRMGLGADRRTARNLGRANCSRGLG